MVFYIRALTMQAVQSATRFSAGGPYVFKRGTTPRVGVAFVNEDGTPFTYPAGAVITLGFKPIQENGVTAYDGPYTIAGSTGAAADENGVYWIPMGFAGAALDAELGYDPPTITDDVQSCVLTGAVRVVAGAEDDETQEFQITVFHDVNIGTEGAVMAPACAWPQLWNTITRLAGGTATDLDDQATAGVQTVGNWIAMSGVAGVNGGGGTLWKLEAAAGRVTGPGLQQPLDFNAGTNDVIWVQMI